MSVRNALYRWYESILVRELRASGQVPAHIGVILDGNRRWAKQVGATAAHGHQKGADKITEVLEWSADAGVEVVTLWMLSTDNLSRDAEELDALLEIICSSIEALARDGRWKLRHMGDASLLPAPTAARIAGAIARSQTAEGLEVNVAVGYGGRHEIADAVRAFLLQGVEAGH